MRGRGGRPEPQGTRGPLQRGAALVIALLVMAALLLLGTTFLTISSTEMEIARNAREATQAFYVAATGMARLQRDLVAQFGVPYRARCPNLAAYAGLTRTVLTTGEPLGVPGQRADQDGSVTCAPPGTAAYYPVLDESNQPVPPVGLTWRLVPYVGGGVGGTYRVEVRNATVNGIDARVTAFTDSPTRASRQIEARFQVDWFSPAEHALFVEGGIWNAGPRGRIIFAGPVFAKGWSDSFPGIRLGDGGSADQIVNHYKDIDPTLYGAITPPVVPAGQDLSLNATLRVYKGPVQILNSSASVGEPTVGGTGLKESLDGVYTNQGFTGSPGAANVYADNGAGGRFDLPREVTAFPDLTGPYTGPPLPPAGAAPASHDASLRATALGIEGSLTIDKNTDEFSFPPRLDTLRDCTGNCLIYKHGDPPRILVKGVLWVKGGDITLGGSGANRLPAIRYEGAGTLYARKGTTDSVSGSIQITSDLLPWPLKYDETLGARFPTDHRLGLISGGWFTVGDSSLASAPTLRIAASIFANSATRNSWSYQIAGSLMTRYFYVSQGARIYYVPALAGARPPGMPGVAPPKAGSPYVVRTLSWRDVMP